MQRKLGEALRNQSDEAGVVGPWRNLAEPDFVAFDEQFDAENPLSSQSVRYRSGDRLGLLEGRFGHCLGLPGFAIVAVGLKVWSMRQVDRVSDVLQTLLSLTPSMVLAPVRNLRLLGSVTMTRVFEDNPEGALPPYLFDAPGTKTTATVTGSYRLARILNLNLTATSVRNTDGRSTYDVRMETRAVF